MLRVVLGRIPRDGCRERLIPQPGEPVSRKQVLVRRSVDRRNEPLESAALEGSHLARVSIAGLLADRSVLGVDVEVGVPLVRDPAALSAVITRAEWSLHQPTWASASLRVQPSMSGSGSAHA